MMNTRILKSDGLLLLTATIWGFAFVAQRVGMDYVGPFTFNGIRFALGGFVLIPFIMKQSKRGKSEAVSHRVRAGLDSSFRAVALPVSSCSRAPHSNRRGWFTQRPEMPVSSPACTW